MDNADIYSNGQDTNLYIMGDTARSYTKGSFDCNSGDLCNIYCPNQDVCDDALTFYCDSGTCAFDYNFTGLRDTPDPTTYPAIISSSEPTTQPSLEPSSNPTKTPSSIPTSFPSKKNW